MEIIRGKQIKPIKACIYGPAGIGKSTFASKFPDPLFLDTEDSTVTMDVARLPRPSSWTMLLSQVEYVKKNPGICKTLVLDTADWAERLCVEHITAKAHVDGLEGFGYGKGYVYLEEEFGRLLNQLQDLVESGLNVVVTAHAEIKKIEQPEEIGGYDHWQMKLEKKTMPLLKEWADMLLFANYKVNVVNVDNQGAQKGKNKAQGGKRVMYTTHAPWWDAKNRHDLPEELLLDYKEIAHCIIPRAKLAGKVEQKPEPAKPEPEPEPEFTEEDVPFKDKEPETHHVKAEPPPKPDNIPKALIDLMQQNEVTVEEIQEAVGSRGYYPSDTPIENYDLGFINGVLVGAWEQVFKIIKKIREDDVPF